MITTILTKLKAIEKENGFRILFAAESGSRAWGLSSTDSDYDIRFIYAYPTSRYLELNEPRATYDKISKDLDFSGWDIKKTLRLFYNGNMSVYEWLHSPTVYKSSQIARFLLKAEEDYFSPKAAVYHYSNFAKKQYTKYVAGKDLALVKKWFYIIRPILSMRCVAKNSSCPPIEFSELFEETKHELPDCIVDTINNLYTLKRSSSETDIVSVPKYFKEWAQKQIDTFWNVARELDGRKKDDIKELNAIIQLAVGGLLI